MAYLQGNELHINDDDSTITVILHEQVGITRTMQETIGRFINGKWKKGNAASVEKETASPALRAVRAGKFKDPEKCEFYKGKYKAEGIIRRWDIHKLGPTGWSPESYICHISIEVTKASKQFLFLHGKYLERINKKVYAFAAGRKMKNNDSEEGKIGMEVRFNLTFCNEKWDGTTHLYAMRVNPK